MKTITTGLLKVLVSVVLLSNTSFAAILDWDESIPLKPNVAAQLISEKVAELTYADEGNYCGGQSWSHHLVDYYTTEDIHGALTFYLKVNFTATLSYDYCKSETVSDCSITIKVLDDKTVNLGRLTCAPLSN